MINPRPTIEDLRDLGDFVVTLGGGIQRAPLTLARCVYSEWIYGEKDGAEWSSWTVAWRSDSPFTVSTPLGRIEMVPGRVRPHLAPSLRESYLPIDPEGAPPPVAPLLDGRESPLDVEEYLLAAGVPYHARIERESYLLPPGPGEDRPRRRHNAVLVLADLPFLDGRPQAPLTVGYRGRTY